MNSIKKSASEFFRPLVSPMYLALVLLGIAGNLCKVPLFFGIDFIFGSIATLTALALFGGFWGVVATAIASCFTIWMWGHPYGALVFTVEALFVGTLLARFRFNLALAAGLFWVLLGVPFDVFYLNSLMKMEPSGALLISLKQGTNGIFNAVVAGIIVTYSPLLRWKREDLQPSVSVFQAIFNAFVVAALIPALILLIYDARSLVGQLEKNTRARLDTISTGISIAADRWRAHHATALSLVAQMAQELEMKDPARLQKVVHQVNSSWPDLLGVFITDETGKTIAFEPLVNAKGESTLGLDFSDRVYFQELKSSPSGPHISSVFMARGGVFEPVLNVSAPIVLNGEFVGIASSSANLRHLAEILDSVPGESGYRATLIDSEDNVIASNVPELKPLTKYSASKEFIEPSSDGFYYRWPKEKDIPVITRWQRSSLGRELTLGGPGNWKLIVEIPMAPLQSTIYVGFVNKLGLFLGLIVVILSGSLWVASRIARPLSRLSKETTGLPDRLKSDETIHWPATSLLELKALVENFRSVMEALKKRFDAQTASAQKLDETNAALKQQVEERDRMAGELKEQSRILELVSQVGLSFRGNLELESLVQAVTDAATALTNAKFGAFFYTVIDETGERMTLYTISGVPKEEFAKFPTPRNTPIFEPTFKGTGIVRMDDVTKSPLFGKNPPYNGMPEGHLAVRSYLAVPVLARNGESLGGLFFGHPEPGVFSESSERLVAGIAAQAAVAIDNSRLYEDQKRSENKAVELAKTQAFLAEAGQVLGSSLDSKAIKRSLAQLTVPRIADWCLLDIANDEGKLVQFTLVHSEPELQKIADEFFQGQVTSVAPESTASQVLKSGASVLTPTATPENRAEAFGARSTEAESAPLMEALGIGSFLCVPLKARDRVFGTLTLVYGVSGRRYSESDLRVAEDLARRASTAVDHARLYAEAQAINRIKDEFLATLSHELRTPLTAILGHSELLKIEAPALESHARQSLEAIHRNAQVQHQIIADLLDASAIITGKFTFNPIALDPNDVVKAAVQSLRFAAESKNVGLELKVSSQYCEIIGDPTRLQQVVWNLLSNALKFTDRGGNVRVETRVEGPNYVIEVKDTGEGIEPAFLPYVFDRFRQEDSSITRKFGGLGLGLSIVRQLVELHGGVIRAISEGKDRGATFLVYLPRAQAQFGDNA